MKKNNNVKKTLQMNNYCLRRLAYALSMGKKDIQQLLSDVNYQLSENEIGAFVAKEDAPQFVPLPDYLLIIFLDSLIQLRRGRQEGAPTLSQKERVDMSKNIDLNNNLILNKFKIAFELKTEDIIDLLALADFRISKSELTAFFRKPEHRNYRECGNQLIRNFLTGLTIKFRQKADE